jgi:tRNA threonylcarbamoyladenosine biosynthesis protein TsaE
MIIMNEFVVHSLSDLDDAVEWVLKKADGRKKIMLYGDMGAGKTTFTKAFCKHLGVTEMTSSPTFSVVNEYIYEENGREHMIHHLDLYRLKNLEEALDIGIEDYLYDDDYCLIEWCQIIEPILPTDILKISIEILDISSRKIVIL